MQVSEGRFSQKDVLSAIRSRGAVGPIGRDASDGPTYRRVAPNGADCAWTN